MLDKVLLILLEGLPVLCVLAQVDLVDGPEAGHLIFVHLPDVVVLDGEDDEAVGVILEERFRLHFLSLSAIDDTDL